MRCALLLRLLVAVLPVTLLAASASTSAAAAGKPRLAILDVRANLPNAQLGAILTEIVTTEAAERGTHQVVSSSDIGALLGFEKQKELAGCTEVTCMAEIGGALGVEFLLITDVAALGKTFVVNVKLLNIKQATVDGRVYETVKGEDDVLIETIKRAVTRLLGPTPSDGRRAAAASASPNAPTSASAGPAPGGSANAASPGAASPVDGPDSRPAPASASAAAAPSEAATTPSTTEHPTSRRHHFGLLLGAARATSDVSVAGGDVSTTDITPLYLSLFYDGPHLAAELAASPGVGDVTMGTLRLVAKVGERFGVGGEFMMIDTLRLYRDSATSHMGIGSAAAGGSARVWAGLDLSLFAGVSVITNVERPLLANRSESYRKAGGRLFVHADAGYAFDSGVRLRVSFVNSTAEAKSTDALSAVGGTLRGVTRVFVGSVGYDFAGLFD